MRYPGLESIRGLAAVMVLLHHMCHFFGLHERLGSAAMLLNWGIEAVIVFFVLSGVVIRISFDRKPRSPSQFLWTRAIRLLPLYILAVVAAVAVLCINKTPPTLWTVVGNLLLLQTLQHVYVVGVLISNIPLWSLMFEAFFYGVFAITIGQFQRTLLVAWAIASGLAMASQFVYRPEGALGQFLLVLAYSSIWLLGYFSVDLAARIRIDLPCAFAWFGLLPMAARLPLNDEVYMLAARHFLVACTVLPLFIALIGENRTQTNDDRKYGWIAWGLAYVGFASISLTVGTSFLVAKMIYLVLPLIGMAVGFVIERSQFRLVPLIPTALFLGQLSYALYLFHYPIIFTLEILKIPSLIGMSLAIPLSFVVAYLAEFHVHPYLASAMSALAHRNRHQIVSPQLQPNDPA